MHTAKAVAHYTSDPDTCDLDAWLLLTLAKFDFTKILLQLLMDERDFMLLEPLKRTLRPKL